MSDGLQRLCLFLRAVRRLSERDDPIGGVYGGIVDAFDERGARPEDLADEIERLQTEAFTLAAGVCEHRSGDEHGNPFCLMCKRGIL